VKRPPLSDFGVYNKPVNDEVFITRDLFDLLNPRKPMNFSFPKTIGYLKKGEVLNLP
jgi:hypothetical protein